MHVHNYSNIVHLAYFQLHIYVISVLLCSVGSSLPSKDQSLDFNTKDKKAVWNIKKLLGKTELLAKLRVSKDLRNLLVVFYVQSSKHTDST